jgi:hypothetical protein
MYLTDDNFNHSTIGNLKIFIKKLIIDDYDDENQVTNLLNIMKDKHNFKQINMILNHIDISSFNK